MIFMVRPNAYACARVLVATGCVPSVFASAYVSPCKGWCAGLRSICTSVYVVCTVGSQTARLSACVCVCVCVCVCAGLRTRAFFEDAEQGFCLHSSLSSRVSLCECACSDVLGSVVYACLPEALDVVSCVCVTTSVPGHTWERPFELGPNVYACARDVL